MAATEVNISVNFTTCNGVKCYNGKCDGQQKVCVCNEGYFGTHCEYAYSNTFWVFEFNLVGILRDPDHPARDRTAVLPVPVVL